MAQAEVTTTFNKKTYLFWYETMLRIRRFEERAGMLYQQRKIRGFCHLYIGQEAVAAGIQTASKPGDPIITAYRDHGLALARGITSNACMAELYGKSTGCTGGKGGSMHFFDVSKRFYGGHGIVGAQIGLGAGLGFAEKYKKTGNVAICLFGDGAARQGILHEVFNMCMTWKVPVVFICENNFYAMGTSVDRTSNVTDIAKLGLAYDMPSEIVDGMSCEEVHNVMEKALDHCRSGKGPYFLEIKTYRYKGHSMSDPAKYRTKAELQDYKDRDPIKDVANTMIENGMVTERKLKNIENKIKEEVDECVKFAQDSPYPDPSELYTDNYTQKDYPFIMD